VQLTEGRHAVIQLGALQVAGALSGWIGYRGASRLAYTLGTRIFDHGNSVVVRIGNLGRLRIDLRDGYWINLLFPRFRYEPEVAFVLERALARPDVCFIDCGANIGYWSLVASGMIAAPGRVVAVEASPPAFRRLAGNAALNENRFRCLPLAIWSHDGERLEIVSHDQRHAGSSVVSRKDKRDAPEYQVHDVGSVTLDTIGDRYIASDAQVVVKLDVEGAEIAALQGASRLLASRRPLLVYEDHGNDSESTVSRYLLEGLGMSVYYCDDHLRVERITTLLRVRQLKHDVRRGYNLFACSSRSEFAGLLEGLAK
jgi:FkbM family methyltransferase